MPWSVWYPASTPVDLRPSVTDRRSTVRSQTSWLLLNSPEAFLGNRVLSPLLTEGVIAQRDCRNERSQRLPLLAWGFIRDETSSEYEKLRSIPVLAFASGVSGQRLRIVMMRSQRWEWQDGRHGQLELGAVKPGQEGHWCGNGAPVTQIRFATIGGGASRHWILVQTASSTVVLESEYKHFLTHSRECRCDDATNDQSRIHVSVVHAIDTYQTGGSNHVDVSCHQGSATGPPQLAIVDSMGKWTVWSCPPRNRSPTLQHQGGFSINPGNDLFYSDYRIIWLGSQAATRQPSSESWHAADEHLTSSLVVGAKRWNPSTLVICDHTTVKIIKLGEIVPLSELVMTGHLGTDNILDVQVDPANSYRFFILTTTSLYWIDVSRFGDDEDEIGNLLGASQPQSTVLMSQPHVIGLKDDTIKLSISSVAMPGYDNAALATISSSKSPDVAVFWFTTTSGGDLPQSRNETIRFKPQENSKTEPNNFQTLLFFPRSVFEPGLPQGGTRGENPWYLESDVQFFQVLSLGTDLSLMSCLWVTTSTGEGIHSIPLIRSRRRGASQWTESGDMGLIKREHKADLGYYGNKFAFVDFAANIHPWRPSQGLAIRPRVGRPRLALVDLSLLLKRLAQGIIGLLYGFDNDSTVASASELVAKLDDAVRTALDVGQLTLEPL
jgi:RNA polymerase I-specific transcription initiation factor RRN6